MKGSENLFLMEHIEKALLNVIERRITK